MMESEKVTLAELVDGVMVNIEANPDYLEVLFLPVCGIVPIS